MVDDPAPTTTAEDREKLKVWWTETLVEFGEAQRSRAFGAEFDLKFAEVVRNAQEKTAQRAEDAIFDALHDCITVRDYRVVEG